MGALAEAFVAYGKPLIDQTDGSHEQLEQAMMLTQLCYNLAMLPEDLRDEAFREMRTTLKMPVEEFKAFRDSVILPMIQRHHEMFPRLHQKVSRPLWESSPSLEPEPEPKAKAAASREKYPGTDRYAPCPCGSGEKYKFCCGAKGRR